MYCTEIRNDCFLEYKHNVLIILSCVRRSSSLSKSQGGSTTVTQVGRSSTVAGSESSTSHTRSATKAHSSTSSMSGQQESTDDKGNGGARPRNTEDTPNPPLAGKF